MFVELNYSQLERTRQHNPVVQSVFLVAITQRKFELFLGDLTKGTKYSWKFVVTRDITKLDLL